MSRLARRDRLAARRIGLAGVALGLALAGCSELEPARSRSYHPAELSSPGPEGVREVTLTEEAARRIGLRTTRVTGGEPDLVVSHAALIYDRQGKSWVYVVKKPLTYLRVSVVVEKEAGEGTLALSEGPPAGTEVVTTGATQVYGAELGMEGKH